MPAGDIIKLGDVNFKVREIYFNKFWNSEVGDLSIYKKYFTHKNPQLRYNVKRLHDYLYAGLTPEINPNTLKSFEKIRVANGDKSLLEDVNALNLDNRYDLLVKLYHINTKQAVKNQLSVEIDKNFNKYLEGVYKAKKYDELEDVLWDLPINDVRARHLAVLLKSRGQALDPMFSIHDITKNEQLYLSLYDAIERRQWGKAIPIAEKLEKNELLVRLRLLNGNFSALLEYNKEFHLDQLKGGSFQALLHRVNNEDEGLETSINFIRAYKSPDQGFDSVLQKSKALVLQGDKSSYNSSVATLSAQFSKNEFHQFIYDYAYNCGRYKVLFDILEYPEGETERELWLQDMYSKLLVKEPKEWRVEEYKALSKLEYLTYFYFLIGDVNKVESLLQPLFNYANKHYETHPKIATGLFKELISRSKIKYIKLFYFDKYTTYSEGFNKAFKKEILLMLNKSTNVTAHLMDIFKALEDKEDEASQIKIFEKSLVLAGSLKNSENYTTTELEKEVLSNAEQLDEKKLLDTLMSAAYERGDLISIEKLKKSKIGHLLNEKYYDRWFLSKSLAEGNWAEAELYLKKVREGGELNPYLPDLVAKIVILKRLGRQAEADKVLKELTLASSVHSRTKQEISMLFALYSEDELALEFFEKSLIYTNDNNAIFNSVNFMNFTKNIYAKKQMWGHALSVICFEMSIHIENNFAYLQYSEAINLCNQFDIYLALNKWKQEPTIAKSLFIRAAETADPCNRLADYGITFLNDLSEPAISKKCFKLVQQKMKALVKEFPTSASYKNQYAWFAAKSGFDLENAKRISKKSLELRPHSSAYMDTYAEVCFALGDRDSALKHSKRSLNMSFEGLATYSNFSSAIDNRLLLLDQYLHFKNDKLP